MMADRVFAPAEAKGGIPIHNSRTALLFIEYQNEFTSEGGKLHSAVRPCMMQNNMLEKSAAIMNEGRARGVKIFHVPISFKTDASDNPNRNLGILAGCAADSLFTENTWNAAFHPSMQPDPSDIVIKGKKGLDAFPGTDLEAQLKAHGIETVALAGFLTNCCVESTMRTAYEKGFNVVTLVDATATTSVEGQAVTSGSYGMFSQPMTVAEFSRQISVAPTGPMSSSRESHGGKGFGGLGRRVGKQRGGALGTEVIGHGGPKQRGVGPLRQHTRHTFGRLGVERGLRLQVLQHFADQGGVAVHVGAYLQKRRLSVAAGQRQHVGLGHDAGHQHRAPGQVFVAQYQAHFLGKRRGLVVVKNGCVHRGLLKKRYN